MGLGGISPGSLLLIFLILLLLLGTKRIKNIGNDLGSALRSFRDSFNNEPSKNSEPTIQSSSHNKSGEDQS